MSYGDHDPHKTCVYNAFVYCALPCARGGAPPECRKCGWNPAVDRARRCSAFYATMGT